MQIQIEYKRITIRGKKNNSRKIQEIKNRKREKKVATRVSRVGETIQANCGMMMTIIEDFGYQKITVKFEDGTIVSGKDYGNFKLGKISNPTLMSHVGETNISNAGFNMEIISQNGSWVDVRFEDGTVVNHKSYYSFKIGSIGYPLEKKHIGEERLMNNGQMAKIVKYNNTNDVEIVFEDGTHVTGIRYSHFSSGVVINPNCCQKSDSLREAIFAFYLSQIGFSKYHSGYMRKFSDSWGNRELDMFNEDLMIGVEYDGLYWHSKSIEKDLQKDMLCKESGIQIIRIRECSSNKKLPKLNSGVSFEIDCKASSIKDMEFVLKTILEKINKNTKSDFGLDIDINRDMSQIQAFLALKRKNTRNSRIGEVSISNNGESMKIIEYFSGVNITVQFEDGTVVTNKTYANFKKGDILNPNFYRYRIGEQNIANNGIKMEIVEYFSSSNITIRFENGVVVHNKSYSSFLDGKIGFRNSKPRKSA